MATEKDANRAREQYSGLLRRLGAHAIAVDETTRKRAKTFAVIAFFEKKPDDVPAALKVSTGKGTREVPLLVRVAERFKPE